MTREIAEGAKGLLSGETLAYLREQGKEIDVAPGELVIRRGDPGRFFYVVLSGELEIRLEGREGHRLPLSRLAEGASFGELSILRGEPVSADVAAIMPSRVLAFPAQHFHQAMGECETLRQELLARLASNLDQTTNHAWLFFKRAQTLSTLVRGEAPTEGLVAGSGPMKAIHKKIPKLGELREPVLISGEPGTGKVLTARLLHDASGRPEAPLIVVRCPELPTEDASRVLLGTGKIPVDGGAQGGIGYGLLHLAHGGTLVLRDVDAMDTTQQALLGQQVEDVQASVEDPFPDVFLVATSGNGQEGVHPELSRQFSQQLNLPPLAKRRRDILPLAKKFLQEADDGRELSLSTTGEHALVSLRYRQHNVKELKDVVELAARCSDGQEIRAEHIFSGQGDDTAPRGLHLGKSRTLSALLRPGVLPALRGFVFASFATVILLCLMVPGSSLARVSNGFVWSVWEPVVFGVFFVAGALWCTVCPLSTAARLSKRFLRLRRPPPPWMRTWGIWLAVGGFFLIVWSERVFHMTRNPWATGIMLLTLISVPAVLGLLYEREAWCRYLCPLGKLAAVLSPSAVFSVGARRSICTSSCSTVDCYKGTSEIPGCPTFHHPQQTSEAYHCKLCLNCLKSCPHRSASIYLRPPLQGLWKLGPQASTLMPMALAVFLLAPILLASQNVSGLDNPLGLTLAAILAVALSLVLGRTLPGLLDPEAKAESATVTRVGFALVAIGWGPLMAYQAGNIPVLEAMTISVQGGSFLKAYFPSALPVLVPIQVGLIAIGAIVGAIALPRIRALADQGLADQGSAGKDRANGDLGKASNRGWTTLFLAAATYVLACFALLV